MSSLLYINFKPAADGDHCSPSTSRSQRRGDLDDVSFTGDEAKNFYENLTSSSTTAEASTVNDGCDAVFQRALKSEECSKLSRRAKRRARAASISLEEIFKACQNGDTAAVNRILCDDRLKVAAYGVLLRRDAFGWTPLMSASCSGNVEIVRTLLQCHNMYIESQVQTPHVHTTGTGSSGYSVTNASNADLHWWNVADKKGRTARHLAAQSQHADVVSLLDAHRREMETSPRCTVSTGGHSDDTEQAQHANSDAERIVQCDLCKLEFAYGEQESHLASTVHRLNVHEHGDERPPTFYEIPAHNRGYRLLVRNGWQPQRGLGPHEDGRKLPVSTALKRSRAGLGQKAPREETVRRITHFKANELDETRLDRSKPPKLRKTKAERARDAERVRRREIALRRELSLNSIQ
ncbi:G patch domain and ankyrin repeat-containing protein 1 homolog [Sycon ciliatum]|uniref:G patch domain and ankyrin repeat-containing protein 1 homolog n=1 Tax=Sycon ciliatum TaxID=27933 RepID=UPI0031F5F1E7